MTQKYTAPALSFEPETADDGTITWRVKGLPFEAPAADEPEEKPEVAEMEQAAILAPLSDLRFGDVDLGTPLVGGSFALVMTELVDGVLGGFNIGQFGLGGVGTTLVTRSIEALLLQSRFVTDIIGKEAAQFGAGFIVFDAARAIIPLDRVISNALRGITGGITRAAGGGGNNAGTTTADMNQRPPEGLPELVRGRLSLAKI